MYNQIKIILLIGLIKICTITPLRAQNNIVGRVINSQGGLPVQGAYIRTNKSLSNSVSDGSGMFRVNISDQIVDTLIIEALGYNQVVLPIKSRSDTLTIKLVSIPFQLPEVNVYAIKDWKEFWSRLKLTTNNPVPAESEIIKKVDFNVNGTELNSSNFKALSHFEGLSINGLQSYLRGMLFWYVVHAFQVNDTAEIIQYDGLPHSELFTDIDRGLFLWLLAVDISPGGRRFGLGRNVFKGITNFGNDSVYVVEFYPEEDGKRENTVKFNRATSKFYSLFSAEKRFYIRKSDFQILRIDYKQNSKDPEPLLKDNIQSIKEISGSIGFQYYNGSIHPSYIYQFFSYTDKNGNHIKRSDSSYFSNTQFIQLNEPELKKKYQLAKLYRNFPIRSAAFLYKSRIGHFRYVPIKK